jgi:alpha-beta hydrolase superfamily lysophospholipase
LFFATLRDECERLVYNSFAKSGGVIRVIISRRAPIPVSIFSIHRGIFLIFVRTSLLIFVSVYVLVLIIAIFFSEQLIFQPQPPGYRDSAAILKLTSSDGAKISAIYLPNPVATFTVLFSHGNAEDIGYTSPLLEQIQGAGFSVFAYDYQGYGTSEGKPAEAHTYDDEEAAYNYLTQTMRIPPNRIIAFGRSVGTGPAVNLASRRPVAGLILQSPFLSAFRVMTRVSVLPFDRFNNLRKIKTVHCPVLIIHGTRDTVINVAHGKQLFAAANEPKQALWVEGANHNDVELVAGDRYANSLRAFADFIQQHQPVGLQEH